MRRHWTNRDEEDIKRVVKEHGFRMTLTLIALVCRDIAREWVKEGETVGAIELMLNSADHVDNCKQDLEQCEPCANGWKHLCRVNHNIKARYINSVSRGQ